MSDVDTRFEMLAVQAGLFAPRLENTIRRILAKVGEPILEGDWGSAFAFAADQHAGVECLEALARVRRGERPDVAVLTLARADRTFCDARRDVWNFMDCAVSAFHQAGEAGLDLVVLDAP